MSSNYAIVAMLAQRLADHDDTPVNDEIVVLRGATWVDYQRMLDLNELEIYRKLGVREVWFWRRNRLTAHVLSGEAFTEVPESKVLPGIDLTELASYLDRPTASQAIREYRAALLARRA